MTEYKVQKDFAELESKSSWPVLYQSICRECQRFDYTYEVARLPKNRHLNRYRDVNPYDHTRIVLQRGDLDYINANLIEVPEANRKYILTQGPLSYTTSHFWLMAWEQNSSGVLMLNKIVEKNEVKCHRYWPSTTQNNVIELLDVRIKVEQLSEEDKNYYVVRKFRMTDMDSTKTKEVVQFHYTTWPDFGVPTCPVAFLEFLKVVRESGVLNEDQGPAIIHCSAGIGRSGTFCLVDSCLAMVEKGEEDVDAKAMLLHMRRQRMGLIQTPDQLRFSYMAISEGIRKLSPDYESAVDVDAKFPSKNEVVEEAPPSPPPRGESLIIRPLPALPPKPQLGHCYDAENDDDHITISDSDDEHISGSESDDGIPPALPPREIIDEASTTTKREDTPLKQTIPTQSSPENMTEVRRRKNMELKEKIRNTKRKIEESENEQAFKRSLYKPLMITAGIVICGVLVYAYFGH